MATITKEDILQTATEEFRKRGLKFTIQDIASSMHIAKKTIYQFFDSKEELMIALLNYGFDAIHANKREIAMSDLPIREKIRKIMIAMPEQYMLIDFRMLADLNTKMPAVYAVLMRHLETNWDPVITLLENGIAAGEIRSTVDLRVLRMIVTSAFQSFVSTDQLVTEGIQYQDALSSMMDIIMDGIGAE